MTLEEALSGKEIPPTIRKSLILLDLRYFSFNGQQHNGQIIVHRELKSEVQEIFEEILLAMFPIEKIVPVVVELPG